MTSSSNIENENNNNNNNISEQQQQKVILANDNQIDTTTSTSSPNNEDTVNKQLLSDVNKQLTSSSANPVVHFDISSPSSPNNDDDENVPMSPNTTIFTNNVRKAMSTHLWSPTMSQNRPAVRAANKMRRQSSVVEFYLQHEDSYL